MSKIDDVRMEDLFNKQEGDRTAPKAESVRPAQRTEVVQEKPKSKPTIAPKRPRRAKKSLWRIIAAIAAALIVLGLIGWGVYSYMELQKVQNPEYAEQQAQQETQGLLDKVGKHMELPDGEAVVATVSDVAKLSDQPFFEKAENGDKVLIFSDSSVAIIYRESTDKIVNSGPIAITSSDEEAVE